MHNPPLPMRRPGDAHADATSRRPAPAEPRLASYPIVRGVVAASSRCRGG